MTSHNPLKQKVIQTAAKLYSDRLTAETAKDLDYYLNFYKGEPTILSSTLADTQVTVLTLFDDAVIRTETFINNDDASKILTIYSDAAGTLKLFTLNPKDSVSFPSSCLENIYLKASAPSLAFTAWIYTINV
jgi:hypothetical protein